ncbi:MAG: chemotaxis protein CheX [Bacteriovoracaceae bacterium]|nr:chemotaxis protein CheX [Bacteriovoracaceae bacterium]
MHIESEKIQSFLPEIVPIFGATRLEKIHSRSVSLNVKTIVSIPFIGSVSGVIKLNFDIQIQKLKNNEKAFVRGILTEASNILAGVTISDLADDLEGHIMLAPPQIQDNLNLKVTTGSAYTLHILDKECNCLVEIDFKGEL